MTRSRSMWTWMVCALLLSCSRRVPEQPLMLDFVIDDIAANEWSHFDDGSFEVQQTVTVRVTAPPNLRGRIFQVRVNPLAPTQTAASIGSQWSVELRNTAPDDELLETLVYRRITQTASDDEPRGSAPE